MLSVAASAMSSTGGLWDGREDMEKMRSRMRVASFSDTVLAPPPALPLNRGLLRACSGPRLLSDVKDASFTRWTLSLGLDPSVSFPSPQLDSEEWSLTVSCRSMDPNALASRLCKSFDPRADPPETELDLVLRALFALCARDARLMCTCLCTCTESIQIRPGNEVHTLYSMSVTRRKLHNIETGLSAIANIHDSRRDYGRPQAGDHEHCACRLLHELVSALSYFQTQQTDLYISTWLFRIVFVCTRSRMVPRTQGDGSSSTNSPDPHQEYSPYKTKSFV